MILDRIQAWYQDRREVTQWEPAPDSQIAYHTLSDKHLEYLEEQE